MVDFFVLIDENQALSLEELLMHAGEELEEEISQRTVRLYATQGLIDRPGKDGRSAIYGRRQLLQLLLIRFLAKRGLSLSAIAPFAALPNEEIELQLSNFEKSTEESLEISIDSENNVESTTTSKPFIHLLGDPLSSSALLESKNSKKSNRSRLAASRWSRFVLAPGVEVHISDNVSIPPSGVRRSTWRQRLSDRLIEQLEEG